jgi:hypothetical protein
MPFEMKLQKIGTCGKLNNASTEEEFVFTGKAQTVPNWTRLTPPIISGPEISEGTPLSRVCYPA